MLIYTVLTTYKKESQNMNIRIDACTHQFMDLSALYIRMYSHESIDLSTLHTRMYSMEYTHYFFIY